MYSPAEVAKIVQDAAVTKTNRNQFETFISAITAGVYVSIAFTFFVTTQVGANELPWGVAKLIGGLCFSLGIILCVVFGAELFTSSTMTIIGKVSGKITILRMLRNWLVVYSGNFIGTLVMMWLIWFSGQLMVANGQWGIIVLKTAQYKLTHSWWEVFHLGILCNLMVCISVWLSCSGKRLIDKAFIMILPITMFVASGFEHCVANMFMIPLGVLIHSFASPEFWLNVGVEASQFDDLTLSNFVTKNLIPATLGNIIGGAVLIGLVQWFLFLRKPV